MMPPTVLRMGRGCVLLTVALVMIPAGAPTHLTPRHKNAIAAEPSLQSRLGKSGTGDPAKQDRAPTFASNEQILEWINRYRVEPDVTHVPAAVRAMSRLGLLKDHENAGLYVGFLAGVIGDNQIVADELVSEMFPLSPAEQAVVIKAIAYSGLPEWKDLMGRFIERMPARKVLIEKFLFGKEPALNAVPLESGPSALDTLWGIYFATGNYEPIQRIIAALQWAGETKDVTKATVGNMAKWMLAANASNEKDVLDLCRIEVQHQPDAVAKPLREVIAAAEGYEVPRLRRAALEAIDELKRRGPVKEATAWASAAQLAPTAIALACVAASALGQVEAGIPCVVGGALSQGAAKLLTNEGGAAAIFGGGK